jgi:hypothetical protein
MANLPMEAHLPGPGKHILESGRMERSMYPLVLPDQQQQSLARRFQMQTKQTLDKRSSRQGDCLLDPKEAYFCNRVILTICCEFAVQDPTP